MKMDFDYDIIKEFIPIQDKSRFLVFESVQIRPNSTIFQGSRWLQKDLIFVTYRMSKQTISKGRFSSGMVIPLSDYLSRKREKKINEIINLI